MLGLPDGTGMTTFGVFFLILVYGYILFRAATLIGDGSEKLLLLYGPGIIGGLVIPILGAVPDGAIVLVSGLGPGPQESVTVGVGTLAGSTIMLLTLPWAASVILGRRDLNPETGKADKLDNGRPKCTKFSLTESVVTTFANTPAAAKIMMLTSASYLIVAVPALVNKGSSLEQEDEQTPALIGMVVTGLAFLGYSLYQLQDSKAQTQQAMHQQKLQFDKWKGDVATKFGHADSAIEAVFDRFDRDGNGVIDRDELHVGFQALGLNCSRQQIVDIMAMYQMDEDKNSLSREEFKEAARQWTRKLLAGAPASASTGAERELSPAAAAVAAEQKEEPGERTALLQEQDDPEARAAHVQMVDDLWRTDMSEDLEEEEETYLELTNAQLLAQSVAMLVLGTAIVTVFSDPMVDAITAFGEQTGIPAFYVSFIVTPVASNASEIYSALVFAKKKTKEGISLGFSALYGAACMNSTLVLCIFCVLVYVRELCWTFLAETIAILAVILIVGVNGLSDTVYVWQALLVSLLFPVSIALVAVLDVALDDEAQLNCTAG